MRIIKKVFIIVILFSLFSCESEESKINKAKEVVKLFASSTTFDDEEKMRLYYPNKVEIKGSYLVLKDFEIIGASLNNNIISVIGKSQDREISFDVKKESGKYTIIRSRGFSMFFNSNLYKYCRQIGCIKEGDYDAEISRICDENQLQFDILVEKIKRDIEQNVRLESHSVKTDGYYYISGDITYKNYSRFTLIPGTYNLYIEYLNSKGKVLFRNKEVTYSTLAYRESNTIFVNQNIIRGASKIAVSLEITNTDFIKKVIAEYAKGEDCTYSNNL
jgi:hypothetical protein